MFRVINSMELADQATITRALRLLTSQRQASKRYYEANRTAINDRSKLYWETHREEVNLRRRVRYQAARQKNVLL